MSLLMDALRRAEEAKRSGGPGSSPDASPLELSLDPLETPSGRQDGHLPPLSRHLDALDADRAAEASTPPLRRVASAPRAPAADNGGSDAAERNAARNLFAAKRAPRSSASLRWFLGLGGLAMIGIAGYFWWQFQAFSKGSLSRPVAVVSPASPAPVPPVPPAAPGLPVVLAEAETPRPAPLPATPGESTRARPLPRAISPAPRAAREPRPAAGMAQEEAMGVFRLGSSRAKQEQALDHAYDDWQANRLDDARRGYEQVLRSDARNADALLGLAAIAGRQGRPDRAQDLYLRVLESDPANVTAQAALISLRGPADAAQSESRLKTLLASQPDSAALHFALGNLYARQGRWSEAQQAYFQAYAVEPDNGDYLFNVAVSLDHLRQNKLAAQYYRMAISAAEARRSAFDKQAAAKRILELQP